MSPPPGPPSLAPSEALVLEMLLEGDRFGLELVAASDGRLKRGSIYVTLGRMEDKGFVESWQEPKAAGSIGLPRRLYRATPYGRKVLVAYRNLHRALHLRPKEAL
ncbi:MAG: helix-turn-helix transcriptional regulator [Vicinamibacterales bacterium]